MQKEYSIFLCILPVLEILFFFFLSSVLCHRSHVGPFAALYHWVGSCNPVNECSNDCLNHVLSLILNLFFSKKGTIQKLLL